MLKMPIICKVKKYYILYIIKDKHNKGLNMMISPYVKDQLVKCPICGKVAMQDQYGNGECKNCGWEFSADEEMYEKKYGISYPMLVTPTTAREQYKKGLPFKAPFNEFVNGLFFYSEMEFTYKNINYAVFLEPNYTIVFCSENMQQEYKQEKNLSKKQT